MLSEEVSSKTLKDPFRKNFVKTLGEIGEAYRERENTIFLEYSGIELVDELEKLHNERWVEVEGLVASLTDLRKEYDDKLKVAGKENELLEGCYYEGRRDGVNEVSVLLDAKKQKRETE